MEFFRSLPFLQEPASCPLLSQGNLFHVLPSPHLKFGLQFCLFFFQIYAPKSLTDFFCPSLQAPRRNHCFVLGLVTQITFFEEGVLRSFSICIFFFFHFPVTSSFLCPRVFPRVYFPLQRSFKLCPSCVMFRNLLIFHVGELLAPRPTIQLKDHPPSAVRGCSLNVFAITLCILRKLENFI